MTKRGLLTSMFLVLAWWGRSQEFQPGEQAKGLAEFKNVSVDYCTGRFNYQIPLFELNPGDYKLPVSLAYTASGMNTTMVNDQ